MRHFVFSPPPFLDEVDTIPWHRLQGNYNQTQHIPRWLRELASSSPEVAERILLSLDDELFHTYPSEAASYAIPFLLRLLLEPLALNKAAILEILVRLSGERLRYPDITSWRKQKSHEVHEFARLSYEKASSGIPIYLTLLGSSDPMTRLWAVELLGCFPQQARVILPTLMALWRRETDIATKATVVCALADSAVPKRWQWFARVSQRAEEEYIAFTALCCVPKRAKENTPEWVVQRLAAYLIHPPSPALHPFLPSDALFYHCLEALFHVERERLRSLVPWFLQQFQRPPEEVSQFQLERLLDRLLSLLFQEAPDPHQPRRPYQSLTNEQRLLLETLLRRGNIWNYGNVTLRLKEYGLPHKREDVARYLGINLDI